MPWDVLPLQLPEVMFPASHPLAGSEGQVYGYAVRGAAGVVLFDTGAGPAAGITRAVVNPPTRVCRPA